MSKRYAISCSSTAIAALVGAALLGPAQTLAGPGCMNKQRTMAWNPYPYSPMGPYRGRPAPQQPYMGAQAPMPTMAPYSRPRPAERKPAIKADEPAMEMAAAQDDQAVEAVTVRIMGMRFEPARIRVEPGTRVTWIQEDRMPHTITGKNGLRSQTLYGGQSYSHTFQETGTHDYVCSFHPSMKGLVVVEGSAVDG